MENVSLKFIQKEQDDHYSNSLFVSDLPKETTNEDLQKLFKNYHFKFCTLNNIKNNVTWAQVYLDDKEWATKARHELNGTILTPINATGDTISKPIRISEYEAKSNKKQQDIKKSLLIKNIHSNLSQKEFYNIFLEFGDIYSGKIEYDEKGLSKGFGYIYYYTEESAENAKKNLNGKEFYGKPIEIVNLIPGKKSKNNLVTLFVRNLPESITEDNLNLIFGKFGKLVNISINQKGFAYISYNNLDSASKCVNEMKTKPINFPNLPNVVVKFASSKEERESNRNFISNENFNEINENLNIQFNYLYDNPEIKDESDLEREIRLFIKVIMLMDYIPKEVLIDFESMSGLVNFGNTRDYNYYFKKYNNFCTKNVPLFECLPYNEPPVPTIGQMMMMQGYQPNQVPYNPQNLRMNNMPRPIPNIVNNMRYPMNNTYNNMEKNNFKKNYDNKNNFNNFRQMDNNNKFNNNQQNYNDNNKKPTYIFQRPEFVNNNQKYFLNQNYGSSFNININMNPNPPMLRYPLTPQQQMLLMYTKNRQMLENQNINSLNYQFQKMNLNNYNQEGPINFDNNYMNFPKKDQEKIDHRNLQNLNPSQLHSQFNKPPVSLISPNMLNSKEQEDLVNEIADSIYEIVLIKYPEEASKITGMIKEKGYEKMNMLLSKQEDLNELIEKAHEMINNSKKNISEDNECK